MAKYSRSKLARYSLDAIDKGEDNLAEKIAVYLVASGHTDDVNSIARDILQLRADESGVVEITAIVAHPVDDSTKSDIELMVRSIYKNAKEIIINEQIDRSEIGGTRIEFANALLDSTVDARLASLREKVKV